jgi:hypothetical protein
MLSAVARISAIMRARVAVDRALRIVAPIMPIRAIAITTSIREKPRERPSKALLARLPNFTLFIFPLILI